MTDDQTIAAYLAALASAAPTPGGGSAAGLVSALGCALGEMVVALSPDPASHPDLHTAATRLAALRSASMAAMARDEAAYARYIAATKLPKGTAEEKTGRRGAMQSALVTAAEAPLALAHTTLAALHAMPAIAAQGNNHVLSDARIGAMLAEAAIRAALINVRVNTALIKDSEIAARLNDEATAIEADARGLIAEVESAIASRTS